jgi:hypothetical protein
MGIWKYKWWAMLTLTAPALPGNFLRVHQKWQIQNFKLQNANDGLQHILKCTLK